MLSSLLSTIFCTVLSIVRVLGVYFLLFACREIQLNRTDNNEADTAIKVLCLCDLLFINLRGINLVKCILLKNVLLWKILVSKRGTRWMKVLHETHKRQIWRRTRITSADFHFSCVESVEVGQLTSPGSSLL